MYILEVYVLEKKNYYDSYAQILDFLGEDQWLDLDSFVFLLDLLCFGESDQKKIISEIFNDSDRKRDLNNSCPTAYCKKDHFYRLCIKYELPLFELIKILKF